MGLLSEGTPEAWPWGGERTAFSPISLRFLICLEPNYAFQDLQGLRILFGVAPNFFHRTLESSVSRVCILRGGVRECL